MDKKDKIIRIVLIILIVLASIACVYIVSLIIIANTVKTKVYPDIQNAMLKHTVCEIGDCNSDKTICTYTTEEGQYYEFDCSK